MAVDAKEVATKKIFIAEGDPALQEILVQIISEETPYQSLLLSPQHTLLEDIKATRPNLLLLDCHLPRVDALALCDRLHFDCERTCPSIILTSTNPLKQGLKYQHMAFLNKPFDLEELLDTIDRLLI